MLFPYELEFVAGRLFQVGKIRLPLVVIDKGDEIGGEVDDLLQILGRHVEQVAETAGDALEVPNVSDRGGELDVAHALPPHLGTGDLDAAALTYHAAEAHPLVLAAVTLPVSCRPKDALIEEPFLLRLQRPIVDRLRLLHLSERPRSDLVACRQAHLQFIKQLRHYAYP